MTRIETLKYLETLARPPLELASQGTLQQTVLVEEKGERNRAPFTYWELIGRLLCGMAPWFELTIEEPAEQKLQSELLTMAQKAIEHQVNPDSSDYTDVESLSYDFSQVIVDSAFLAQAFLRSPTALWGGLDENTQERVLAIFRTLRNLRVHNNNWILFSGEIEAALSVFDGQYHSGTVRHCFTSFETWYVGDGWYSDGPRFSLDYYNSLVIHPMLLDISKVFSWEFPPGHRTTYLNRSQRQVELLERMMGNDGSFPIIGRSLAYRGGVFHLLAQLALEDTLPDTISPETARTLLGRVIAKTLPPSSYGEKGILNIGLVASQPSVGENYISTGSLYLCSTAFLGLGLPSDHAFWNNPPEETTFSRAWNGFDVPADSSIY